MGSNKRDTKLRRDKLHSSDGAHYQALDIQWCEQKLVIGKNVDHFKTGFDLIYR